MPQTPLPTNALLRISQIVGDRKKGVPGILPMCKSAFWEGVKAGRYPQPIKLSPGVTAWRADEIYALTQRDAA